MFKSKRGGVASEEIVGVIVVFFFAIIAIFAFIIADNINQSSKQKQVEASFEDLKADYNLNYFLRLQPENDKTLAEMINEAYTKNDYGQIKILFNKFFGDIYNTQGLNYDLVIGGKNLNHVLFTENVADSLAQIPLRTKQSLNVELIVGKTELPIPP